MDNLVIKSENVEIENFISTSHIAPHLALSPKEIYCITKLFFYYQNTRV